MAEITSDLLDKRIKAARGVMEADLVLKNAIIPNLFTDEMIAADIAIVDGYIAGIGRYEGQNTIDCTNKYVCPGFVDGHVHLESTMVLPGEFAKAVVPSGTLTAIVDPHEIANVCGLAGIKYFLAATENLPMTIYFMAPSCVPATPLERNGAKLSAADLAELLQYPRVLGLGEVMDYMSVLQGDRDILEKIVTFQSRKIDGHLSGVFGYNANAYASAGIRTNHECSTVEEVLEYLRLGLYIQVRESSSAKNLDMILTAVKERAIPIERLFFCTDDKSLTDIRRDGHIIENVRKALGHGFSIYDVLRMAALNAAHCYGLEDVGAVASGYRADLLIVSDIQNFCIERVIKGGTTVSLNGSEPWVEVVAQDECVQDTVRIAPVRLADLELKIGGNPATVISIVPQQLITRLEKTEVNISRGLFVPSREFAKVAAVERHRASGKIGLGIVRGFGIENAAIASTIGHDSHNLIVVGDNDCDMMAAIEAARKNGGGLYVVREGQIMAGLPLPIAGLMSDKTAAEVISRIGELTAAAHACGISLNIEPFGLLSFLSLTVIPELRITPDGLYDVLEAKFIKAWQ